MTKNMTEGSPMKLILGFSIPMLFGMLFQQFYNLVDTMIVGKTLGVDALAGVGATSSINFMIIGFCMGVCGGFAIPVAQQFGAQKYEQLRRYVYNGYLLSVVFSIVLTALSVFFCRNILTVMRTPESIYEYAYAYIVIIFAGIPTVFLYNIVSSIIRALGDSKTPVIFLVFSAVLNIILDFVLIQGFKIGVAGAAVATDISQLVSGVACLIYMNKRYEVLKLSAKDRKAGKRYMINLCMNGIPMGLQYSITAIGSVILQTAVNTLGATYVAAMTAGSKIFTFTCCPFDALGQTMAPYAGQNIGARKLDRVGKGLRAACIIGFIVSGLMVIVVKLFGDQLTMLFLDEKDPVIMQNSTQFLIIVSAFYCLLTLVNTVRFTIQGMGFSSLAIIAGVMEMIARGIAGMLLVPAFGYLGACYSSPLAWLLADAFLIPAFFLCKRKVARQLEVGKT